MKNRFCMIKYTKAKSFKQKTIIKFSHWVNYAIGNSIPGKHN